MVNRTSFEVVLRRLLFCFFLSCQFISSGQNAVLDQNPFTLKFNRISLNNVPADILFPAGYDSVAQRTANDLESNWKKIGSGFPKIRHRFSVILQNQGLISNGFVSLVAPRAEFLTTSTQDPALLGTNDWMPLLVSHEMRHVHQNNAARQGLANWVHGFFGSYGQAVYSNLLVPNWLWEGDAVETESRLNGMGRSSIPQFKLPLKAYLNMYGIPNYSKMMGKSYRQMVPNHYVFGQYLSQQMTQDFGADFIPKLWQTTLNHPGLFAFSNQFKKIAGVSIDQYSTKVLSKLADEKQPIDLKQKGFTQYQYPNYISEGRIIAMKSGFSDIKQLVEIQNGKERRLTNLGPMIDASMLSASSDFVVWSELVFHPRWGQKQQARVVFYDLKSGLKTFWNPNEKLISPSISPDSKFISIIHIKENGQTSLKVYDREQRKSIAERVALPGEQFLQPRLSHSGFLVYILKKGGNKSVCIWDYQNKKEVFRGDFGQHNIAHPYLSGDWIYLNFPAGRFDQIARFNWKNQQFELLTDEQFGGYNAVFRSDSVIYSAYSASGHKIMHVPLTPKKLDLIVQRFEPEKDTSHVIYPVKEVSKWNLINPFTWGPVLSSTGNQLEYSVISRDVLNNLQAAVGVRYGMNEKTFAPFARLSYQAWFPILDFNYQRSDRQTQLFVDNKTPFDSLRTDQWKQQNWDVGIRVPLNLTHSAYQEFLQFSSNIGFLQVRGYDLSKRYYTEPFNGNYSFLKHQVYYSKLLSKSLWDVQARKGVVFQANWNGLPFKQTLHDELWNIQVQVYLPGIFKHDGVLLHYAYQQEMAGNYQFSSSVYFPRGYLYTAFNRISTMGIDYRFPILNTDINLGRVLYVTRLKGNLFGDLGLGKDNLNAKTQSFHSFGVDLSAQFHAFRFSQSFELGVRAMYVSANKTWAFVPLVIDIGF